MNPPKSYTVIAVIALVWNLMGLAAFIMQVTMSEATLAAMPAAERELYESMPSWVTVVFAVAVLAGTLGSIGLVMRKFWAIPVLAASLIAVILQLGYVFLLSNVIEVQGAGSVAMPLMVFVIAVFLFVYARSARDKGWLS